MLTLYRRHRASCKNRSRRNTKCFCPIWVQGVLRGEKVRQSLDLTNWEAANRTIQEWQIHGKDLSVSVEEACGKFLADCEARKLSLGIIKKYKYVTQELIGAFGGVALRSVSVDDLRTLRNGWKYAPLTARKRLEYVRTFFSFCVSNGWLQLNPAKSLKPHQTKQSPALPFSESEWEKILWATEAYPEIHKQTPRRVVNQLKAIVVLMRFSGLRISDVVSLKRDRIDANGRLFLYQAKTGQPVQIPLPADVVDALRICDDGGEYYFWSGVGTLATALTHWQGRFQKLFRIAGIVDGHSHRFRDTFSVDLLSRGVPLQTVSLLLGHTSITTTEKHYAPFVKSSQDALEAAVMKTWN